VNSGSKRLGFRLAKEEDRERLFAWRNLPESIAASKDGKKVLRFHHDDWFSKLLKEQPSRKLWIAELQGGEVAVGWIRAEPVEKQYELSWLIDSQFRTQGFGSEMLTFATESLRPYPCRAWIRSTNLSSQKMAQKCGYQSLSREMDFELWQKI